MIVGELFRLLGILGVEGIENADAWRRVAIVRNWGVVPTDRVVAGAGFKLLVQDHDGRPAWFGRCSWATRTAMLRETMLLDGLTKDHIASRHVPESRAAHSPDLFVQLSRHLGVRAYRGELAGRKPGQWVDDLIGAITTAETVLERATVLFPELRARATAEYRRDGYRHALETVTPAARLSAQQVAVLAKVTDTLNELPCILQHGDLWPANLLRAYGRWWLIDFAECGHVANPLYDVFHMLHTAPRGGEAEWYALPPSASREDPWRMARRAVLDHFGRARGLDGRHVGACLVFYLIHLTSYRLRPGVSPEWSADLRREVRRVADFLDGPGSLETLLR